MTRTEEIRCFVRDQYIAPARAAGANEFEVHARDVARGMELSNRFPLICGALDLQSWWEEEGIDLVDRSGPRASSTVVWRFRLGSSGPKVVGLARLKEEIAEYGLGALDTIRAGAVRTPAEFDGCAFIPPWEER